MKFDRLTKALEKNGLKIEVVNERLYVASGATHSVEFYKQDDRAVAVYVKPNNDQDDSYTDYFCGFFPKTIKRVIEYVKAA